MRNKNLKVMFITPPINIVNNKPLENEIKTQPIGVLYIATYLKSKGVDVFIQDSYGSKHTENYLKKKIKEVNPDIVGLTSVTVNFYDALKVAEIVKKCNNNILTVIGGVHVSVKPIEALKNKNIDIVVIGEGEKIMYQICENFINKTGYGNIKNIYYKKDNNIIKNESALPLTDLDELPFPDHSLLQNLEQYNPYPHWGDKGKFSAVITSRGCPYNCQFCSITKIQGRKYRHRTPENVIRELKYLKNNFNVQEVSFRDGTVGAIKDRMKEICHMMIEQKLNIKWNATLTIREGNDVEFLKLMKKAGCFALQYGVETGDPDMIKKVKKISVEDVKKTVLLTNKVGIEPHGYFIYGLPGETKESMRNTLNLALNTDFATVGFAVATPYPGTELYAFYKKHNLLKHEKWNLYRTQDYPVFKPQNMTEKELYNFMKYSFRKYYLKPKNLLNELKKIKKFNTLKTYFRLGIRYILGIK